MHDAELSLIASSYFGGLIYDGYVLSVDLFLTQTSTLAWDSWRRIIFASSCHFFNPSCLFWDITFHLLPQYLSLVFHLTAPHAAISPARRGKLLL